MKIFAGRLPFEITAALFAIFISGFIVGGVLGCSVVVEKYVARNAPAVTVAAKGSTPGGVESVAQGRHLFLQNCAHCHAEDATGDEGPDLHKVRKSDERITAIIQQGIKGEMPKFGQKFKEEDVQALVAYVRSLR